MEKIGALQLLHEYDSEVSEGSENQAEPENHRSQKSRCLTKRKTASLQTQQQKRLVHELINVDCKCYMKCSRKISIHRRLEINEFYWSSTLEIRRSFVLQSTSRELVKRRRVNRNFEGYKRSFAYIYNLNDEQAVNQRVCATFYLNTLGYPAGSNNFIYRSYKDAEKKGLSKQREDQVVKSLEQDVKLDILAYSPTVSHYRREHAPNVLYLPSDISCKKMFERFRSNRQESSIPSCSYWYYRRILRKMNIRFTKLGNELCEKCRTADEHMKQAKHMKNREIIHVAVAEDDARENDSLTSENEDQQESDGDDQSNNESNNDQSEDCEPCVRWRDHKSAAISSRNEYVKDKHNLSGLVVSVDLQKVIQLPRMEGFKEVIFTKRIIAMNETFAPLGGAINGPTHAILWNETISGRNVAWWLHVIFKLVFFNVNEL